MMLCQVAVGCSAERVAQMLENLSKKAAESVFSRYAVLAERVQETCQDILLREKEYTSKILQCDLDAETGYIFTNDAQ